jgi:hypothetical protein
MPTSRHLRLGVLAGATATCLGFCAQLAISQSQGGAAVNEGRQISLKDQLTFGLLARTKADREFIDRVVAQVEAGTLPRPLVDSTFIWARGRAASRRDAASVRPMIYFRPGLVARAKKLRIDL